jgi:hypothetical protein
MKSMGSLLFGLVLVVVLILGVATAVTGPKVVDAYVHIQAQPETVTDIAMRSRQTATVTDPHRQTGILLGAGLCAIVVVLVGGLTLVLLFGEKFLKQAKGLLRKSGGSRPAQPLPPQPQHPRIVEPYDAGETRYALPSRSTRTAHEDETGF